MTSTPQRVQATRDSDEVFERGRAAGKWDGFQQPEGGHVQTTSIKFDVRDQGDGCFVLRCNGGLSWEDREMLAASVEDHIAECAQLRGVVLDLSTVQYVNSAGLGALFQLIRSLRDRGAQLVFSNVPPGIGRLFHIVGLDTVGAMHDDVAAALVGLKQDVRTASSKGSDKSKSSAPLNGQKSPRRTKKSTTKASARANA